MYGSVYSHLSAENLSKLGGLKMSGFPTKILNIYFSIFGYPEIAGQFRYPLVTGYLRPNPGERILDAGCGNGIYANTYGNHFGALITGIDLRPHLISIAKHIAKDTGSAAKFITMDVSRPSFASKAFDKIYCIEVLEHIATDQQTLNNFSRLLKSGGTLVLSVPRKAIKLTREERLEYQHPEPLAHVRSGYTPQEISRMAQIAGLKLEAYTPYYHSFAYTLILLQQQLDSLSKVLNLLTYPLLMPLAYILERSHLADYAQGYVFKIRKQ